MIIQIPQFREKLSLLIEQLSALYNPAQNVCGEYYSL